MLPNCKLGVIVLLCAATVKVDSAAIIQAPKADNAEWWKNAVIYQVYTRSFKDSNSDGVGDIKGIIEKLGHLEDAGVTAIWLPPIFESVQPPTVDFGYEVTDYTKIHAEYGAESDLVELITQAHAKGIKIIMEFVPNHSSKQHQWFTKSEAKEAEFLDYYVWKAPTDENPPNNWISHFNEPAWTLSPLRGEYYLHQFGANQPDLNYHSTAVRTAIKNVLKTWLDLGVDGFLLGDVPYLIEDADLTNEEPSDSGTAGDYESLIHAYTSNQEGTYEFISELREFIDTYNQDPEKDPRIIITKAHTTLDKAKLYCGEANLKGAHFTYNFLLASELSKDLKAQTIYNAIEEWTTNMPEECVGNWVLGNHDMHRVATRFEPDMVDGLNTLLAFLPGVMITYNGEEIGQENGVVNFADCKDPIACADQSNYDKITRDYERTPFHWSDAANADFTTGSVTWLPVSDKHTTNNLKHQSRPGYTSHYHTYQALTKLRQEPGFSSAAIQYKVMSENVLRLSREDADGQIYVALISTSNKEETVDLSDITKLEKYLKVVVANSASKKHNRVLSTNNIVLDAYESLVLKALPNVEEGKLDWWEHAIVYQIYPLSFKDESNDGYGDLQGIISKLDYLKETGFTAAWLSPIYKSPQVDAGYDISDYRDIDSLFGEMKDFDEMVEKAHAMGIKIIMDFVPNHSSNEHVWFTNSEKREAGFEDFYIWHDGKDGGTNPPNNWISLFDGPAWSKSTIRNQWYLHQFAKEQPDLNYRNPLLVAEMKDILKFWMDKGVDGFRMDAVPYLFEDDQFRDEEPSGAEGVPETEHGYLDHIYTSDLDGTFDMIYQWREFVDDYTKEHGGDARILMTEAYTTIENTMKYYGDENRDGGHFTFNFQLITKVNKDSNAKDILEAIQEWMTHMPENRVANWVLGNHDQHRVATRFGSDNVDGFNMLTTVLPGVMVTYNGEEIGQENGEVTWEQCKDPRSCKGNEEDYEKTSRDFERTPFHWDETVNAGFNEGHDPWLPVSSKHTELNLKAQNDPEKQSYYNVYKELMQLRSKSVLTEGSLEVKAISDNVLSVTRALEEGDTYMLLFNVGDEMETIELTQALATVTPYVKIVVMSSKSYHSIGNLISSEAVVLNAHESIIVTTTTETPTPNPPGDDGASGITVSLITLIIALICSVIR